MVAVAQLVESWIVIPVVVGSSPIGHPKKYLKLSASRKIPYFSMWELELILKR